MNKLFLIIILMAIAVTAFAQYPLAIGEKQLNAGLGLSSWDIPVYVGLDYGFKKDVSLGGELSFNSYREKHDSEYYNHAIIGILGNGNYHFNHILELSKDWDVYAGLNIGLYIWSSPNDYPGDHTSGLGLGAQIGGRYYFSDKFGVNLELGGGNVLSGGKFGITYKL